MNESFWVRHGVEIEAKPFWIKLLLRWGNSAREQSIMEVPGEIRV